jgi:hypothetical protein
MSIQLIFGDPKVNILSFFLGKGPGVQRAVHLRAVHLIVEDPKRAKKALDDAKLTHQETEAEQYELPNKPGAPAQSLEKPQPIREGCKP